jgi:hypothetical protein
VRFIDITPQLDALKKVNRSTTWVRFRPYAQPADVPTIVVPNVLLAREDFPAANAITKLIFDAG